MKKHSFIFLLALAVLLTVPGIASAAPVITRLAGSNRYQTSVAIAQNGWTQSDTVILATGADFPDALAGSVVARKYNAPLLLTPPAGLDAGVAQEIRALQARQVIILGSSSAVSDSVARELESQGLAVPRLQGADRFATAVRIAQAVAGAATPNSVYLANGDGFADALSVAPVAARLQLPVLLTSSDTLPAVTLSYLLDAHVSHVTLIGSSVVISDSIKTLLQSKGISVDRLQGADRFATNTAVAASSGSDFSNVYLATGLDFPDALSGAALAALHNSMVIQVQPNQLPWSTYSFLSSHRGEIKNYFILGSSMAVSAAVDSSIRTNLANLISLMYLGPGNSSVSSYESRLSADPNILQAVNYLSPSWLSLIDGNGTVVEDSRYSASDYQSFVQWAHGRGLSVLPLAASPWGSEGRAWVNTTLQNAPQTLVNNLVSQVNSLGADGLVLDFEDFSTSSTLFTNLVSQLADALHARNKLLVVAVMAKDGASDSWLGRFDYAGITAKADLMNIMTYDNHIGANDQGPVAPVPWIQTVLDRAINTYHVPSSRILMGLPLYGRHWYLDAQTGNWLETKPLSCQDAMNLAASNGAPVQRSGSDPTPGFSFQGPYPSTYQGSATGNTQHQVWFDDPLSWSRKLDLAGLNNLGGVASWGFNWPAPPDLWTIMQQKI